MRVLCLLHTATDPRIAMRIDMLKREDVEVEVLAFERGHDHEFGRAPDCPTERLGLLPARKYFSRLPRLIRSARTVRAAVRRNDIVYAFSPDMAFLGLTAGAKLGRPLLIEIADVQAIQVEHGWRGRLVRSLEKKAVDHCRLLVLTSEEYLFYYRELLSSDAPAMIIENKLSPDFTAALPGISPPEPTEEATADKPLRLGWFGRLRDEWTLQLLETLAGRARRFHIVIAGTPAPLLKDAERRIIDNPAFEYLGGYNHPQDLPALYSRIDLSLDCYPPKAPNGWSRANRYYEACLFRKPLLARGGTADAANVERRDIGLSFPSADVNEAADLVERIAPADLVRWRENLAALPPATYTLTREAEDLHEALARIGSAPPRDSARAPRRGAVKILCLLSTAVAPRVAKRIDMLKREGFEVEALAFKRRHDREFGRTPDCPVEWLGQISPREYFLRIPKLLLATGKVRAAVRRNDVTYAFGPDMGFLGLLAGMGLGCPRVIETADIQKIQMAPGWPGKIVRILEKTAVDRCRLLVLTSAGYRSYYRELLSSSAPIMVIENKLSPEFAATVPKAPAPVEGPAAGARLRIGWFGRLRDEWTLQLLEALAERPRRFHIVIAGTLDPLLKDAERRVVDNPAFEYLGGYHHPQDLPDLYRRIDLTLACHSPELPRGWSQTNRYYDACLFRKPLVVRTGSMDAACVEKHDIGLSLNSAAPGEAAALVERISLADLARWRKNLAALPSSVYVLGQEAGDLRDALTQIHSEGGK